MPADTGMANRQTLRKQLRLRRKQLSSVVKATCAHRLAQNLCRHPLVMNSRHIAIYLPADGEIDTQPLVEGLCSLGKSLYLPVLVTFSDHRLWFSAYAPGDSLVYNRYGIPEPERVHYRRIKPAALDLVLTPLVAFDDTGNRIGMGGGPGMYLLMPLEQRTGFITARGNKGVKINNHSEIASDFGSNSRYGKGRTIT
jgi:5-formyltetrahydrofolate cyclo-ligase